MNANILLGIVFIVACYGAVSSLSSGQDDKRHAVKRVPIMDISDEDLEWIKKKAKFLSSGQDDKPHAVKKVPMMDISDKDLERIKKMAKFLSSGQNDTRGAAKMVPKMDISVKDLEWIQKMAKLLGLLLECSVSLPQRSNFVCKVKRFMELLEMKGKWKLKFSPYGYALLKLDPLTLIGRDFINPFTRFYLEGYLQTVLTADLSGIVYNSLFNKTTDKEMSHNVNYRILSKFFEMSAMAGGVNNRRPSKYEAFIDDKTTWISDRFFTQQRLAGINPMSLRRVTLKAGPVGLDWDTLYKTLNPEFDWEGAVQKALGSDDTLEEAIYQGRVYILRYELCDDLPREKVDLTDNDPNRTMWDTLSPIALFASKQDFLTKTNDLVPVAIQMDYTPDSSVYTPDDDDNWMLAKLNVQVTDLGYAQIVEHLGKVHFLMEPFCVVLKRTLSSSHPLHQILKYHCRDVTVPNTVGAPKLVGEGEFMDQLFAFGNEGTTQLLKEAHKLSTWDVTDFRNEIKKRGVDDKKLLPYYPYRDDGEQILKIIENMVKGYVDLYYYDNEDVKKDYEFGSFLRELSTRTIFHRIYVKGLPSKIATKDELCDIVTRIISQLSVQHAAVNYPLTDYGLYTPNLPTKLYNDTRLKEGEYGVQRLPNINTSSIEASFSNALSLFRFDSLFDYGNELLDPEAVKLVNGYYTYLMNVIQPKMQEKNRKRKEDNYLTYPYFIPRWLPNGVQT
ncbi:polyunsaturated fatty acid 5-lipoxygenase isoform X1 [Pocillopora verrucosa]|uniref:polyunsaturated fatty acid 5-lipoxygenase isoform X1 n=1 Tax=Pocillopora verrucosa TaxID=203993 RepID=UPI003341E006